MNFSQFYLEKIVYRDKDNDESIKYLKQLREQKLAEKKKKLKKQKP